MITDTTRLCPGCGAMLPAPPAPGVCGRCEGKAAPHHSRWPLRVKWWVIWQITTHRFHAWRTEQNVWELLLRDALTGAGQGPNPHRLAISNETPAVELYAHAEQLATAWHAAGSPLTTLTAPGTATRQSA